MQHEVIIVGAGLAGLCCARELHERGRKCQILEASDGVGGRVRTDEEDGFLLDRGFQVLLTEYPEAQRVLDYSQLDLRPFEPGALIRINGKFHRFVDPWRRPRHLFSTAFSSAASLGDKLRVAGLRRRLAKRSSEALLEDSEVSTIERLRERGFSPRIIEKFFRPFLGGVFLETDLTTSSRKFEYLFRMFADGDAVLPARGMEEIPRQLAAALPKGTIRTGTEVKRVFADRVELTNGQELRADAVVLATEAPTAARLLGETSATHSNGVTCLYFAAPKPPLAEPILVLNGDGKGPINNLCVPSQVSPEYAPAGQALISATVVGVELEDHELLSLARQQLTEWFGDQAQSWRHLRSYRIPHALPEQRKLDAESPSRRADGIYICGDYLSTASIQGAMVSGRRAAEAVSQATAVA